jgi:hypothetical protein
VDVGPSGTALGYAGGGVCACGQGEYSGQVRRLSVAVTEREVVTLRVGQFDCVLAEGLLVCVRLSVLV